ncbi:SHOCT-like domain-containing protein [Treponema pedis]|uniref:YvlB/LiaX N-terminal domain-containing protein n=1 Tax=Treponema pedis TaxID=409322 RepID=A0A7S6WRA1_9SPIR|nr:hypothetical protein [Treponema pedis]QOW61554.1 hypothetical protein IFE08_03975 [Treponema pedis]
MENEKLEILNMVKDGIITPEEALKLLEAIREDNVKFVFADKEEKQKASSFSVKIDSNVKNNLSDKNSDFEDKLSGNKTNKDKAANIKIMKDGVLTTNIDVGETSFSLSGKEEKNTQNVILGEIIFPDKDGNFKKVKF